MNASQAELLQKGFTWLSATPTEGGTHTGCLREASPGWKSRAAELQVLCVPWTRPSEGPGQNHLCSLGSPMIQAVLLQASPQRPQCRRTGPGQRGSPRARTRWMAAPSPSHSVTTWKLQSRRLTAGTRRSASRDGRGTEDNTVPGSGCRARGVDRFLGSVYAQAP